MIKKIDEKFKENLKKHLPLFQANRRHDVLVAKELLSENDLEKISKIAHTWKGYCSLYGYDTITDIAKRIERFCELEDTLAILAELNKVDEYLDQKEEELASLE